MLKIGTDFSGIGAPETALKRLGIPCDLIFACEIDKYARKSYKELHPTADIIYNDITTRDFSKVPSLDLYVAGFPCQSFSLAGKRLGFDDVRGSLFYNVADFIKHNQPKVFILENVKGLLSHDKGRTYQTITDLLSNNGGTLNSQLTIDVFTDGLGYHVYTKVLNTKDYGIPQNRERIFIVGFKDFKNFNFPNPKPLNKKLKDVIEDKVNDKYFLSKKMINRCLTYDRARPFTNIEIKEIANCITSNYSKQSSDLEYIEVETNNKRVNQNYKKHKHELEKGIFMDSYNQTIHKDISPTITSRISASNCYHIFEQHIVKNKNIRRLTPLECWRLQGFKDDEFYKAQKVNSDTQLYKQAGNTITVDVLVEIFKKIYLK